MFIRGKYKNQVKVTPVSKATAQSHYMQLQIMNHVYNETYNTMFAALLFNMVVAMVALTFIFLKSTDMHPFLRISFGIADLCAILLAYYIFSLAVEVHILSNEFLKITLDSCTASSSVETKFWKSMQPLRVGAGRVCTFETKEFLLFIWGDVVISKLIDLLITF
jgi:hypothetical protein